MTDVTDAYEKDVLHRLSIDFLDLESTGSWDDAENQVVVVTAPASIAKSMRRAYRGRAVSIKDFECIRTEETTETGESLYEVYAGSSYGAGQLLGAVGELLYYSSGFGADFDEQY